MKVSALAPLRWLAAACALAILSCSCGGSPKLAGNDDEWFAALRTRATAQHLELIPLPHLPGPYSMLEAPGGWLILLLLSAWTCGRALPPPASVADRLDVMTRLIKASGRQVAVGIVPSKSKEVEDKLGPREREFVACDRSYTDALRRAIAGRSPPGLIDVDGVVARARAAAPSDQLWTAGDSHWTPRAAWEFTYRALTMFDPGIAAPRDLRRLGDVRDAGDIGGLLHRAAERKQVWKVVRRGVTTRLVEHRVKRTDAVERQFYDRYSATSSGPSRLLTGRTVLFEDSYGKRMVDQLVMYASELDVAHWRSEYPMQIAQDVHNARRVILQYSVPTLVESEVTADGLSPDVLAVALRNDIRHADVSLGPRPYHLRGETFVLERGASSALTVDGHRIVLLGVDQRPAPGASWFVARVEGGELRSVRGSVSVRLLFL